MSPREEKIEGNGGQREEGSLSNKSQEVAEQVKQAAIERVDSVRQSTQSAKQQAADRVRKLGSTVRKVGEHLRVEEQNYIADKAADASQRLDELANYVSSAEISTLVRDTGEIARRNPGVFFGSAFALGLAAGRFLRIGSSQISQGGSQLQSAPRTSTRLPLPEQPSSPQAARAQPATTKPPASSSPRPGSPARSGASQ